MITNLIDTDINGKLIPNAELYTIKPFSEFTNSDRLHPDHIKHISYIYWVGVIGSPYLANVSENDIEEYTHALNTIKSEVGLDVEWFPNKLILRCIDKWKFLQETPSVSSLQAIKSTLIGVKNYLTSINLNERIESGAKKGELVHNPSTVAKMGINLPERKCYMKNTLTPSGQPTVRSFTAYPL